MTSLLSSITENDIQRIDKPGVLSSMVPPEPQEPQSGWDAAADFVERMFGVAQASGDLSLGALGFPLSKLAGGTIGPFVDGGPEMVEGFVGEMFQPNEPPAEGTPARAGYDTLMKPAEAGMDFVFGPGEHIGEFVTNATGQPNAGWAARTIYEVMVPMYGHAAFKKLSKVKQAKVKRAAKRLSGDKADRDISIDQVNKDLNALNDAAVEIVKDPTVDPAIREKLDRAINALGEKVEKVKADPIKDKAIKIKNKIDRANKIFEKNPTGAKKLFEQIKKEKTELDTMVDLEAQAKKPTIAEGPDYITGREQILEDMQREADRYKEKPEGRTRGVKLAEELDQIITKRDAIPKRAKSSRFESEGQTPLQRWAQAKNSGVSMKEFLAREQAAKDPTTQQLAQLKQIRDAELRKSKSKTATQEEVDVAVAKAREAAQLVKDLETRTWQDTTISGATPAEKLTRPEMPKPNPIERPNPVKELLAKRDKLNALRSKNEQSVRKKEAARQTVLENKRIVEEQARANELVMRKKEAQAEALIEANNAAYRRKMEERLQQASQGGDINKIAQDVSKVYNELFNEATNVSATRVGGLLEQAMEIREQVMAAKRRVELPAEKPIKAVKPVKTVTERKAGLARLKAAAERLNKKIGDGGSVEVRSLDPATRARLEELIIDLRKQGKKLSKFIEQQGFDRKLLLAMRQIESEMRRDKRLMEEAPGATGKVRKPRRGDKWLDKETGETVQEFKPAIMDFEQAVMIELGDVGRERLFSRSPIGPMLRGFEMLGTDVMELIRRPHDVNAANKVREATKLIKENKAKTKKLTRKERHMVDVETIRRQVGGPEMLENLGWADPGVNIEHLSKRAAEVYYWRRAQYDAMLKRINETRSKTGKKPITKEEFYAPLMTDVTKLTKNPIDMKEGELAAFDRQNRQTITSRHFKRRKADPKQRVLKETNSENLFNYSADWSLDYIHKAEHLAKVTELLEDFSEPVKRLEIDARGKEVEVSYKNLQEMNRPAYDYINNWKNFLSGDIPFNNIPKWAKVPMQKLRTNVVWSMMAYNVGSMLNQMGALVQAYGVLGEGRMAQGVYDLISSAAPGSKKWSQMMKLSNHMVQRFKAFDASVVAMLGYKPKTKVGRKLAGVRRGTANVGMYPTSVMDMGAASITWFAAFREGKAIFKGNERKAANFADDMVVRTQGSGLPHDIAPIQRGPIGGFVTTLQTFALNNWDYLAKDVFGFRDASNITSKRFARITRFLIGSLMANYVYENLIGVNSPIPNPIGQAIKDINKGEDIDKVLYNVMAEVIEPVPWAGPALKYKSEPSGPVTSVIMDFLTSKNIEGTVRAGAQLAGIPGVNQIKKSKRAAEKGLNTLDIITGGQYDQWGSGRGGRSTRSRSRSRRSRRSRR